VPQHDDHIWLNIGDEMARIRRRVGPVFLVEGREFMGVLDLTDLLGDPALLEDYLDEAVRLLRRRDGGHEAEREAAGRHPGGDPGRRKPARLRERGASAWMRARARPEV
jgi:hypothetical protein